MNYPQFKTPDYAPAPDRCAGCGEQVTICPPDGYWLLDRVPWHPHCASWGGRPFPYAWALERATALRRKARSMRRRLDDDFHEASDRLEAIAVAWPQNPVEGLRAAYAEAMIVDRCCEESRRW